MTHVSGEELTGVWWNTLFDAQFGDSSAIEGRLDEILQTVNPAWVCLQEVVVFDEDGTSPLRAVLQEAGLQVYSTEIFHHETQPASIHWMIASVLPMVDVRSHTLDLPVPDPDVNPWHYAQTVRLASDEHDITILNTHHVHLRPKTLRNQRAQRHKLAELLVDSGLAIDAWGGDLNMHSSSRTLARLREQFDIRTGDWNNPTWTDKNIPFLRANIDYVGVNGGSEYELVASEQLPGAPSDHDALSITLRRS